MDSFKFKMDGFAELKKGLESLGPELATSAGQSAIRATAKVAADAFKEAVPVGDADTSRIYKNKAGESVTVDYGHARDNIKIRKGKPRKPFHVVSNVTFGNAFWVRFLEYGTVKMAAQPFAKPAWDNAVTKMMDVLETQLGKQIDRLTIKHFGRRS